MSVENTILDLIEKMRGWPSADLQKHAAELTCSEELRIPLKSGTALLAPAWPGAWPGPRERLGQGVLRLKWAKGRFWLTHDEQVTALRIEFSNEENLWGHHERIC